MNMWGKTVYRMKRTRGTCSIYTVYFSYKFIFCTKFLFTNSFACIYIVHVIIKHYFIQRKVHCICTDCFNIHALNKYYNIKGYVIYIYFWIFKVFITCISKVMFCFHSSKVTLDPLLASIVLNKGENDITQLRWDDLTSR